MLSKRSRDRIFNKIRELTPRTWGQTMSVCIRRINEYTRGWLGFFGICSEAELQTLGRIDGHIRRRLRAIMLRHWKRRRYMARRLIRLGVKPRTAWRAMYRGKRSWWALSRCPAVHRGLRNTYFVERGLVSLVADWRQRQDVTSAPAQLMLPLG